MYAFVIHFLICNVYLCGVTVFLLLLKYVCKNVLSPYKQYQLCILFLCLLAVPFLPFSIRGIWKWVPIGRNIFLSPQTTSSLFFDMAGNTSLPANLANDFAVSADQKVNSFGIWLLACIWLFGMIAACIKLFRSYLYLRILKKSALPLQNTNVRQLFASCLQECGIKREIPVFSSVFLYSPVLTGFWNPRIYLPISMLSDCSEEDIRFILLHELTHHIHKDNLTNCFINLANVLYWFHPFIRYTLKEMRNEQELSCDAAVLEMLDTVQQLQYGNTLLRFAEKNIQNRFPAVASLINGKKQMKRRILHIAQYKLPAKKKQRTGVFILVSTALFFLGIAPTLSIYGKEQNDYDWNTSSKNITSVDLSSYFKNYEGCFVLYDSGADTWQIYNMKQAKKRISPDSTYKIYDALFALEEGIITADDSFMAWNGQHYPFEEWNTDQTLSSAMKSSVNWYFQSVDMQLGKDCLADSFQKIGYGNADVTGDISYYWMESSLKISPIEQVELLAKLYQNELDFAPENTAAVKEAMKLSVASDTVLYGKTGTGRVNDKNISGWFVGSVENEQHTYFFACNIQSDLNAAGSHALEIALSILADQHILL